MMAIAEFDSNKTCCLSCSKEQGNTNQANMVQCDECPLRHMTKLVKVIYQIIIALLIFYFDFFLFKKAIDTFNSQVYQGADYGM